jgi:hypothetical protein
MRTNNPQSRVSMNLLRRHRAERTLRGCGVREIVMTMNNQSSGSSYFQSVTGQLLAFGVGIVALIVLAAVFVF